MYRVRYKKSAIKGMAKMPREVRDRVEYAIQRLAEDPGDGSLDVKPLQGRDGYRLRVGQWRALFQRDDEELTILVVAAGPRGDVYK